MLKDCCHSSVDLSVLTILLQRVQAPSTPSTLLSFIVFVLYLSCEKYENKQKEAGFGPFFKLQQHFKTRIRIDKSDLTRKGQVV